VSEQKKRGFFSRLFGRREVDEPKKTPIAKEHELDEGVLEADVAPKPLDSDATTPPEETALVTEKATQAQVAADKALEEKKPPKAKKPAPKKPAAKAKAEAKPKEAAKPKAKAAPKPKAAPKVEAKAEAKPAPKPKPKPKPAPKPEPKPEPKTPPAPVQDEDEDLVHADAGPPETQVEWIDEHPTPESAPAEPEKKKSWFQRLSSGLKRSSDQLSNNIASVFTKKKLDQATLDDLEDILIQADLGIDTAMAITEALAKDRFDKEVSAGDVRAVLAAEVEKVLSPVAQPLVIDASAKPLVILMVGVNGSGKTTTIGKLAQKLANDGKSVMLAAGDTFRAAAIEQLQIWGQRTGAPVVTRPTGADASGLAFDAMQEAKDGGHDVLIIDTAGRLQNRDELMAELEKIIRVIKKVDETAPHRVLLTLDATTGQNALNQVDIFGQRAGVTGLVMTKLDGTARGGILVAIAKKFGLPVHFIGVGEGVDDLESFAAADFAAAIAGKE
jgi:fused signal recognition particle receptor